MNVTRYVLGQPVCAQLTSLDDGLNVLLTGGCRTHIGSIAAAEPNGSLQTLEFPGHKEKIVAEKWAASLAKKFHCRVCVVCGIHYDQLDHAGLEKILGVLDRMLQEIQLGGLPEKT